jgi:secondary thiamine-phosphate synthase enzyme
MEEIKFNTSLREEMIDLTARVQDAVRNSGVEDGLVHLVSPHTTGALTINEKVDPHVKDDILDWFHRMVPESTEYGHTGGNAWAHIKASIVGADLTVAVTKSKLVLGEWQGIMFCEFDGPRSRKVICRFVRAL